jgi:hypothetical protein
MSTQNLKNIGNSNKKPGNPNKKFLFFFFGFPGYVKKNKKQFGFPGDLFGFPKHPLNTTH